jgi:hypothetical protein
VLCWPHGQDIENTPAQRDSIIFKLASYYLTVIGFCMLHLKKIRLIL